jgi:hypothetical protein
MLQSPPNLQPGDLVYLCAPAKATEEVYIKAAEDWLHSVGLKSERSQYIGGRHHYFSGSLTIVFIIEMGNVKECDDCPISFVFFLA